MVMDMVLEYSSLYYMSQTVVLNCMYHSLSMIIFTTCTLPHAIYKAMIVP